MVAYCVWFTIWLVVCVPVVLSSDYQSLKGTTALDALETFLFPNRTAPGQRNRQLAITKVPWNKKNPVPCAQCTSMTVCKILDNLRVEETYYPKDPGRKETCNVIDAFAKRISKEIFGNGRAFRDTPQCRGKALCSMEGSVHIADRVVIYTFIPIHRYRDAIPVLVLRERQQHVPQLLLLPRRCEGPQFE